MKKIILILLLVLGIQYIYAQNEIPWVDIAPDANRNITPVESLYPWETIFIYTMPTAPPTSSGAETDGIYYYVTGWMHPEIRKYDMQGNLIETFTIDSITGIRDLAYDGVYYYAGMANNDNVLIFDFDNKVCIGTIITPFACRAIAYNDDLDVFYGNNWSTDIMVFKADGTILDTLPLSAQTHIYSSYYGFAYDNWSAGGPYLWGFSQDGPSDAILVQLELPSGLETGFVKDLGYLNPNISLLAGGLFIYPDYDSSIVIIGGLMQNKFMFGLELIPLIPPPVFFEIGGGVTAGTSSLDEGEVGLYRFEFSLVADQFTTDINDLGNYLFTDMSEGNYMIHAKPGMASAFADSYVPTYYGGQIHWEDVSISNFVANSYDNNIELVEMAALSGGIGSVSGKVFELTTDAEIPLEDAQVMLLNANDECIAIEYTDIDGAFSFGDIALETYGLLVEIPGKMMEPMSFTLTELEPGLSDINLYVTEGSIMLGIGEEFPSWIDHVSNIYPNPARSQTSLNIRLDEASRLHVRIFSLSGQQIQQQLFELNKGQNIVNLDLQKLNSGVFYVTLEFNNEFTLTRKLLIIE
ncbi:MAG: T9SS type A sorting domain-containing protein [Bacteroidales bacterium]|nr:T9SS type A sorting domain-containing protein [Bacteroidales bacterium]